MMEKFGFYQQFGVEELYVYDPDDNTLAGWLRQGDELQEIPDTQGWTSPRLGVRFDLSSGELKVVRPDGRPLPSYVELAEESREQRQRAEQEQRRAEQQQRRAEQQRQRAERLAAQLRALGVEPEA
jgi:hypothetical protein